MSRRVTTTCNTCKTEITLDFEDLTYEEAYEFIEKLDQSQRECPGYHVEFGGWRKRWNLDEALDRAYTDEEKKGSMITYYIEVILPDKQVIQFKGYDAIAQAERQIQELLENKIIDSLSDVQFVEKNRIGEVINNKVLS